MPKEETHVFIRPLNGTPGYWLDSQPKPTEHSPKAVRASDQIKKQLQFNESKRKSGA